MAEPEWLKFTQWHFLFDDLCNRAGYYDDAALASAYCALAASKGQRQFDTAMRNLNNWRSGRHLPRAKSLRILTRLLKVAENPALQAHWDALYAKAKEAEDSGAPAAPPLPPEAGGGNAATAAPQPAGLPSPVRFPKAGGRRFSGLHMAAAGASMLVLGAVLGSLVTASDWRPWAGPADDAPIVPFKPVLAMKVGESRPIYAERGDCGKLPRDWPLLEADLPTLGTGTFSDGGLARRYSKFCQGLTPARAIVFTATRPGVEEFEIQGDFFKLTVTD